MRIVTDGGFLEHKRFERREGSGRGERSEEVAEVAGAEERRMPAYARAAMAGDVWSQLFTCCVSQPQPQVSRP